MIFILCHYLVSKISCFHTLQTFLYDKNNPKNPKNPNFLTKKYILNLVISLLLRYLIFKSLQDLKDLSIF